jgi:hypothetical protein
LFIADRDVNRRKYFVEYNGWLSRAWDFLDRGNLIAVQVDKKFAIDAVAADNSASMPGEVLVRFPGENLILRRRFQG